MLGAAALISQVDLEGGSGFARVSKFFGNTWYFSLGRCKANTQSWIGRQSELWDMDLRVEKCSGEPEKARCLINGLTDGVRRTDVFEVGDCSDPAFKM